MRLHPSFSRLAAATLLALAGASQAGIIEGADVGSFRTFVDTATGTVWADLDNHLENGPLGYTFRFTDYNGYLAALTAAGFTWATLTQVQALTATLPLTTTTEYDALGEIMSSESFGDLGGFLAYANDGSGLAARMAGSGHPPTGSAHWSLGYTGSPLNVLTLADSGLWAYLSSPGGGGGGSVPLPGTLALAGLGLAAVARSRRATA